MLSMRLEGGDKLLAGTDCSAGAVLLPSDEHRVFSAQEALERVVASNATRSNSLGLILRSSTSVGSNANCNSSSIRLPSCHSEFDGLRSDFCLSDIDDVSDDFNLVDASSEVEEDDLHSKTGLDENDELALLSISSLNRNFFEKSDVQFETEKLLVDARKRRKRGASFDVVRRRRLINSAKIRNVGEKGKTLSEYKMLLTSNWQKLLEAGISVQQNDGSWPRLCESMTRSCNSQAALKDWDRKNGLPASHARNMIKSGQSRKMLQDYVKAMI